jgi:hypothetical protein
VVSVTDPYGRILGFLDRPPCLNHSNYTWLRVKVDRFYGLVVRVPGYTYRGPGSIPGATRFSENYWVQNGVHSAS